MKYASEIQSQHIREEGEGNFKVQSQTDEVWYNLSFGSENIMPKCTCPDFCHTGLLCKHFLQYLTSIQSGSGIHYQKGSDKALISH